LEEIISAGIDIGTSTTHVVFSKIKLENRASAYSVPEINIIDKKIFYMSEIYFTPLISETEINGAEIRKIIENEYKKAGISQNEVKTGAVIITGETARKENAQIITEEISDLAGDFVVAAAGPDLEAIIAAKGAGIDKVSEKENALIINFDIGGGTTNIAVFKDGEVIDTACFDIGGRLIKINENFEISYISQKIKELAEMNDLKLAEGKKIDDFDLNKLAEKMAEILTKIVYGGDKDAEYKNLITNHDLNETYSPDYISFSGGVADYIGETNNSEHYSLYNDLGIILAKKITQSKLYQKSNVLKSEETIRATVVGAGSHTTEISGSTIFYNEDIFPIKNIPIVKIKEDNYGLDRELIEAVKRKLNWFKFENGEQLAALSFRGKKNYSFNEILDLADIIIKSAADIINSNKPLIIILEHDAAKVLGQTLNKKLKNEKTKSKSSKAIISIDGIRVQNGDYIDIGKPLAGGKVLPIIIKTLVFDN